MTELWRTLKVGDVIRMVEMPSEFNAGYLHPETRSVYQYIIASRRAIAVSKLDDLKMPWIEFDYRAEDGERELHSLLVNHDGIEIVSRATN